MRESTYSKYGCLQKYAFFHSFPFKIPLCYIIESAIKYTFFCVSLLHSSDFTTHPQRCIWGNGRLQRPSNLRTELWIVEFSALHRVLWRNHFTENSSSCICSNNHAISILYPNIILSSTDITSSITIFSQHSRLDMNSGSWGPPLLKSKRFQKITAWALQSFCFPGIL